jgi:transcriptional regulator with XRE-family HTH domain
LRTAAGWTQRELACRAGVSRSTVQEIEAGRRGPTRAVLSRYLQACGASKAERFSADLLRSQGRAAQRGRRYGLHAPAPDAIRTEADLRAALAAAYESDGYPCVRDFSKGELVPSGGEPVSPAGASRIHRGLALPANAGQLETWLAVCHVRRKDLPHFRRAYDEITMCRAPRHVPARYHRAPAARLTPRGVEYGRETVALAGLAAATARQLPPAAVEELLLAGMTHLAGVQARRNGGGTYMPDLWLTTPTGRGAAPDVVLVEVKSAHRPGGRPPLPPAAPAPTGPGPGRGPGPVGAGQRRVGRLPHTPGRQPHTAAAPRALLNGPPARPRPVSVCECVKEAETRRERDAARPWLTDADGYDQQLRDENEAARTATAT